MRKITQEAIEAFKNQKNFSKSNTQVVSELNKVSLLLHGNLIATYNPNQHPIVDTLKVSSAGWETNTTKERLNGLPYVNVYQQAGQWYLNGHEWRNSDKLTPVSANLPKI